MKYLTIEEIVTDKSLSDYGKRELLKDSSSTEPVGHHPTTKQETEPETTMPQTETNA